MKRWEKWTLNGLALVVSISGVFYFYVKDVLENTDPLAVINHPLQPYLLDIHLLAAPLLIFVMGLVVNSHVAGKLKTRGGPNRKTGWVGLAAFPVAAMSGYILPVLTSPGLVWLMWLTHLVAGLIFAVVYGVHLVISLRLLRSRPRPVWRLRVRKRLAAAGEEEPQLADRAVMR